MKRFFLTGHRSFGNRGCEAIVRSIVQLLNEQLGETDVLVPSDDIKRDIVQWPDAAEHGVEFVQTYLPLHARYWIHSQRLPIPLLKRAGWPFPMPTWLKAQIASVDAVLAIGGDNYSLDYRLPSLIMGIDKLAMDMGKPVILWGASVGPFAQEPNFVPTIIKHLSRMRLIAVRESASEVYLRDSLRLNNVIRVVDPAFTLQPEPVDVEHFWPAVQGAGVLGLNVSPLLTRYRQVGDDLRDDIATFIRYAVETRNLAVLLVPHVVPLNGTEKNNDAFYMQGLLQRVGSLGKRVKMMDSSLNAAQIKHVISQCRYFIGARTHATIAALSSGVPTVSIAYSVKARGINKDLFGHLDHVLVTPDLNVASLITAMNQMISKEQDIRDHLRDGMADVRKQAEITATHVEEILK